MFSHFLPPNSYDIISMLTRFDNPDYLLRTVLITAANCSPFVFFVVFVFVSLPTAETLSSSTASR